MLRPKPFIFDRTEYNANEMSNSNSEMEEFSWNFADCSYSGNDAESIPGFLKKHPEEIVRLNISHNNLSCLAELKVFKNLKELNADNNAICDTSIFPKLTSLQTLTLNNNQLEDLSLLLEKISASFPLLSYLSLLGNKACPSNLLETSCTLEQYKHYRCQVANSLPNLKFLDFKPVTNLERNLLSYADENLVGSSPMEPPTSQETAEDNDNNRKVLMGRLRYAYVGRNSEGNRFIRNNEL